MNHIIVAGNKFEIDAPTILWNDPQGKSFYRFPNSYNSRSWDLKKTQESLDTFVLHHSVTFNADTTFKVLVARKLSVNFIIDDNNIDGKAVIYQCLDVKDSGLSQKSFNDRGPGLELSYFPLVKDSPLAYSEINRLKNGSQPHDVVDDIIHGAKLKCFAPTEAQYASVLALCQALRKALPKIDWQFPKDKNGEILKTTSVNPKGLTAHFHLDRQKIDPAGFPLKRLEEDLSCPQDIYDNL